MNKFSIRTHSFTLMMTGLLLAGPAGCGENLSQREDVRGFIDHMVSEYKFDNGELTALFDQAKMRKDIIEAISRPAEAKPWYDYRPIFLTTARIEEGVEFWNRNAADLARAEEVYGVPPQIITAIIGVESRYGKKSGNYPVVDALATLAFDYPPRAKFFRGELEHYLLLTREEKLEPAEMKGSYAGALGTAQFIPSSYRNFAVDFDADGKRNLWSDPADAIGSVANYFKKHGWVSGGVVTLPAEVNGEGYKLALDKGIKPELSLRQLRENGIKVETALPDNELAALIELQGSAGLEYWIGMKNFYVITRYNHSTLYAMAVYQLSEEIRKLHSATAQVSEH